ncbi:pyruvate, phosphate dikinase, partial [Candidatus Peregrinibacteria bacterium]|nr:pyruvate, phosphate dikinase [Candidatus Peregrinibacteria bacterium]
MTLASSSIAKASTETHEKDLKKYVYSFGEGDKTMKDLLGGKGANLAEMTRIGVNVPHGFIVTTDVCEFYNNFGDYPDEFAEQLQDKLEQLEYKMKKKFANEKNPLLISVRSGAAISMPGMMDTILNLGLNSSTVEGLIGQTRDARFAYDSFRRFLQMFGEVVLKVNKNLFEEALSEKKKISNKKQDHELSAEEMMELCDDFKKIIKDETTREFPENPYEQLKLAIEAVFNSWNNDRASLYRNINGIKDLNGTAVNIQAMVFGNMGKDSGTGVVFTRNPSTGENELYGEFLMNAQGEDVVSGVRTPETISELKNIDKISYNKLLDLKETLETHYLDMQDIEFTIQKGELFILQTRNAKRSAASFLRVARDMVEEGLIEREDAIKMLDPTQLNQLLHPQIKPGTEKKIIAKGLPASPGAACGKIVFSSEDASQLFEKTSEKLILVRKETSPEDLSGMNCASGILTSKGGMTSHAAVVCRAMGKCCISGCSEAIVNTSAKKLIIGDKVYKEGDVISLDGNTGDVIDGEVPLKSPEISDDFAEIMSWADDIRTIKIRTNADTVSDCGQAIKFGAEGIGLCRTEHMFFAEDRINFIRSLILSKDVKERTKPLEQLKKFQIKDFKEIFEVMDGRPTTIRFLDPPLHEFLPEDQATINKLAKDKQLTSNELKSIIKNLKEANPMLGHRGCRLGITFPEIYKMQAEAITEAAIQVSKTGKKVKVEYEIPFTGVSEEFFYLKKLIMEVIEDNDINFDYKIGTMIEIPRACLVADEIAQEADFISFGTNDLTQMTFAYSRDDIGSFMHDYLNKGILNTDPMTSIDQKGVGRLMEICINFARK